MTDRDVMEYDVIVVGAGPAGLACAIRLKQLKADLNVCVLEKAAAVGAHALSGAVIEPEPLEQLLPDWREKFGGFLVPADKDEFLYFTKTGARRLPTPPQMKNHGNFIVSLGQLTPFLAEQAEALGVDVFAGFAAAAVVYTNDGAVKGIQVGDMGLEKDGTPGPNYTPGVEIHAPLTVLAEGARGSLTKQLIDRFSLSAAADPPTFGLGLKELWQLPPGRVRPGYIQHTVGWPVDAKTYGGSFVYHLTDDRLYVGYVAGLDYKDPRFKPFEAFQQFKHHPQIKALLEGGEILSGGARTIAAGGWQALPKVEMPGALLIGDTAGTLNVPKIKGVHQAVRGGVLAAEHIAEHGTSAGFDAKLRASPVGRELWKVRNIKPGFKKGLWFAMLNGAWETAVGGRSPWTLPIPKSDGEALARLDEFTSPDRGWVERSLPPRDRVSAVFFAATAHDENQPVHLKVADTNICIERCTVEYGNPCENFCPAAVYEIVDDGAGARRLQINASNCVHCKACDIKDPYGIITWTTPEGGSGPNYQNL